MTAAELGIGRAHETGLVVVAGIAVLLGIPVAGTGAVTRAGTAAGIAGRVVLRVAAATRTVATTTPLRLPARLSALLVEPAGTLPALLPTLTETVVPGLPVFAVAPAIRAILRMQALFPVGLPTTVILRGVVVGPMGVGLIVTPVGLPLPGRVALCLVGPRARTTLTGLLSAVAVAHVVPPVAQPIAPDPHGPRTQREHGLGNGLEFVSDIVVLVPHGLPP